MNNSGKIIQLQNFSVNDGEGIRTTIFLMGCPLRCQWCSNPETWGLDIQEAVYEYTETYCSKCGWSTKEKNEIKACPECNNTLKYKKIVTTKTLGQEITIAEIIKKVKRQEIFYRFSNGGVTFSGGEPTYQLSFLEKLSTELEKNGIPMWIETCGYFNFDECKTVLERLEHIFFDLKCMDSKEHQKYIGVPNEQILDNIIKLKQLNIPITIRIPAIEEVNFSNDNIQQTIDFIKANFDDYPIDVEILPYHNLGNEKYVALGLPDKVFTFTTPSKERIKEVEKTFKANNINIVNYK